MFTLIILLVMIFIPVPVMLRHMLNGRNAYRGVLTGSLSAVTGVALVFLIYWSVSGDTIFNAIETSLSRVSIEDMNMSAYFMPGAKPLQPDAMKLMLDDMKETTKLAVPGLLIIFSMIIAYVNYAVISWTFAKSGKKISALPPFRLFSLPRNVVIGSLIIYLLSYLTVTAGIVDGSLMMFNLEMLFTFVFSIQGLAVVFYFGHLKKIPKFVLVIISGILFFIWIGHTFLFLLGLTDVVLDIRKRISKPA